MALSPLERLFPTGMLKQFQTQFQPAGVVHCQYLHCCPADWRTSLNAQILNQKMLFPSVVSRMEQPY